MPRDEGLCFPAQGGARGRRLREGVHAGIYRPQVEIGGRGHIHAEAQEAEEVQQHPFGDRARDSASPEEAVSAVRPPAAQVDQPHPLSGILQAGEQEYRQVQEGQGAEAVL